MKVEHPVIKPTTGQLDRGQEPGEDLVGDDGDGRKAGGEGSKKIKKGVLPFFNRVQASSYQNKRYNTIPSLKNLTKTDP